MKGITFSSDSKRKMSMKDHIEGTMLMEEYFKTSNHPEEFQINMEAMRWVHDNILDFYNVIKFKGKIVGSTFMLPCNKDLMKSDCLRK